MAVPQNIFWQSALLSRGRLHGPDTGVLFLRRYDPDMRTQEVHTRLIRVIYTVPANRRINRHRYIRLISYRGLTDRVSYPRLAKTLEQPQSILIVGNSANFSRRTAAGFLEFDRGIGRIFRFRGSSFSCVFTYSCIYAPLQFAARVLGHLCIRVLMCLCTSVLE